MSAPTTIHMNPDILDATGALGCVQGAGVFTLGAKNQMNKLALCAEKGLRSTSAPIVGEVRKFEVAIGITLAKIVELIKEHVKHVVTQDRLARDPNLHHAAVGYLDALRRGGVRGVNIAAPAAISSGASSAAPAVAGSTSVGLTSWEIDGNVRGPGQAERAMRACAGALGVGQGSTLRALRIRLVHVLGVAADSDSPILLATIDQYLQALGRAGNEFADEFARQVQQARLLIAANKGLAGTQAGGWLDPKNLH